MTRSGSTASPVRCSDSSRDACLPNPWRSCSPCASRATSAALIGLPELPLGGLSEEDARAVLATVIPGRLDERVRDRIVAETRGNPLALLELPRGVSAAELAGGFALPDAGDLPSHIEDHYVQPGRRAARFNTATAAAGGGRPGWRRDAAVACRADARNRAECRGAGGDGAVAGDRSAGAVSASAREIGRVPRRVGGRSTGRTRRACRRDRLRRPIRIGEPGIERTRRPSLDEDGRRELIHWASRAQRRGGMAAAAAFLERAVAFTAAPLERASRALPAARAKFEAGDFAAAEALLATRKPDRSTNSAKRRYSGMRAQIAFDLRRGSDAPPTAAARGAAARADSTPSLPARPISMPWLPLSTRAASRTEPTLPRSPARLARRPSDRSRSGAGAAPARPRNPFDRRIRGRCADLEESPALVSCAGAAIGLVLPGLRRCGDGPVG